MCLAPRAQRPLRTPLQRRTRCLCGRLLSLQATQSGRHLLPTPAHPHAWAPLCTGAEALPRLSTGPEHPPLTVHCRHTSMYARFSTSKFTKVSSGGPTARRGREQEQGWGTRKWAEGAVPPHTPLGCWHWSRPAGTTLRRHPQGLVHTCSLGSPLPAVSRLPRQGTAPHVPALESSPCPCLPKLPKCSRAPDHPL